MIPGKGDSNLWVTPRLDHVFCQIIIEEPHSIALTDVIKVLTWITNNINLKY